MSTITRVDPAVPAGSTPALDQQRPLGDRAFQILALASGLLVLVILVLIAVSTSTQASLWFSTEGLKIFTNNWNPAANDFGALAFIYGTAITAAGVSEFSWGSAPNGTSVSCRSHILRPCVAARKIRDGRRILMESTGVFGNPVPTTTQLVHGVPDSGFGQKKTPTSVAIYNVSTAGLAMCST